MHYLRMPYELSSYIGSESKDFIVKAGRDKPLKSSIAILLFGAFWTAFTGIFVVAFLGPLFVGKEVHFESNGVPTIASPDDLGPIVVPALIIGLFVLIGLAMLAWGFSSLLRKGGYFVGTSTRLIHYHKGVFRSIDWEQFSGDIEVRAKAQKGTLSLQMRTGKMVSKKNGPDRYVPDVIYMSDIPNALEIEKSCRRRIKENDPTPSSG